MGAQSERPGLQSIDLDLLERFRRNTRDDCFDSMPIASCENMGMASSEVEKGPLGLAHSAGSGREGMEATLGSEQSRKAQGFHG